jgi:tRNA(Leu) C34 or U34 (ribose-2'-O)-methylase TrmL
MRPYGEYPDAESASATSFNVASAAAMMFYEANRQRNCDQALGQG